MDGMLSLFDNVCHSDYQDEIFHAFLKACSEQQAFVNKAASAIQPVVSKINSKLSSATSRYEGLLLLKTYLPQCSTDILGEYMVSWMQLCLKAGEVGQNRYEVFNTAYQVLKILLEMSENLPEMKRPISGTIVPKIIENFQQIDPEEISLSVLECLEILMYKYGSACGQQKNVLEKSMLQYVDCKENDVMKRVARCLAYLPLLGGGTSHIASWNQCQQKLCATLHAILDELFDDIREVPNSYNCGTSQKLALPEIKESSPLMRVHRLITRFMNVSKCLQAVLISEFPVRKTVLPEAILGVVCRGLAVNSRSLGKKISPDVLMIGAMIPQIHIRHLMLLDSLVTCCRRNLLPYACIICRLVLQTLKWTSEEKWMYGMEKPYCQLREAACNTLKLWLQVSNCGSCVELIADQLVPLVMQDIWFEKESVTLIAQNSSKGNRMQSKPSGQDQKSGMNVRNSKRHIPNKFANKSVCTAALQLLQWVLHSAASCIKPAIHRLLQEKTVWLLFEIQRSSNSEDLPVPFYEPVCRLELYRLLHTLNLEPHTVWPAPTQFAAYILGAGRSDTDMKVSAFCTKSLAAIEKLIHPSGGTLQIPVSLEEMLDATRNYKQECVIPSSENAVSSGNTVENKDIAQKNVSEVHPKVAPEVPVKEDAKQSKEELNSSGDIEIVDDGGEEEAEEEAEEEEDECLDSEEYDSDLFDEDDLVVKSFNSNPAAFQRRQFVAKKFQEQPEQNGESAFVDIADSDDDEDDVKNDSAASKHDNDKNYNIIKSSKINEEVRKQAVNYIKCRNDLQVTQAHAEGKVAQMGNSCSRDKLPDMGHAMVGKVSERSRKDPDVKINNARSSDHQEMHVKFHDEDIDDEEIGELDDMDDIDDDDDDIDDDEPNPKKMKLDSPLSVKSSKSIRDTPEYLEAEMRENETDSMKKDEEIEEDPLQLNGITVESEDVSEEEMLNSFVDVVAE